MKDAQVIYQQDPSKPGGPKKAKPAEVEKLTDLAEAENEPLYSLKGVFPFDFIPNVITIYRKKVSVVKKTAIFIVNITNIPIESIHYVTVNANLFFATLEISDRFYSEQPIVVRFLRRPEAKIAMRMIEGLRLALSQEIDLTHIPKEKLLKDVLKIGVYRI
jgi:hypothetical protein